MRTKEEIDDALDLTIADLKYHDKRSRGALINLVLIERKWQLDQMFDLTDKSAKGMVKETVAEIRALRGGLHFIAMLEKKAILEWFLKTRPNITILTLDGEECTMTTI